MGAELKHKVLIQSLRLRAYHGVHPEEEEIGNYFEFNLEATVRSQNGFDSDEVSDTLDYVSLINLIKKENKQRSRTLENLGQRIMDQAFKRFLNLSHMKMKIEKIDPPLTDEIKSVGIEFEETRLRRND